MNRRVADDPLQALGDVDDLPGLRVAVDLGPQRLAELEAVLEARRTAHDRIGDQLREPVAGAVVHPQHARGIASRRPREHLAERDDLRDRLLAVLLGHIANHALAAAHREVDVDIRHRHALGVQEPLEQQAVAQRVDVGDLQRVGDQRASRRTAARADRDPGVLGVLDEVPDDQEVRVEAHLVDHAELVVGALERLGRRRVAVALAQALGHERAQVLPLVGAVGRRIPRDQLAAELEFDVAALGDLERALERLRPLGERARHLVGGAQIELVGLEGDLRLRQRRLGLNAQQRRVVAVVLASEVVDVAGTHQRPPDLAGNPHNPLVGLLLGCEAVLLDLEVDVVGAERLQHLVGVRPGIAIAPVQQRLAEARLQAAGQSDDTLGMCRDLGHVQRRLTALVALQKAGRRQLDEVAVAGRGGRQQRQVKAVQATRGTPQVIVDDVHLAAQDRLDPVLAAGREQLHRAVHHAVVGQPERRLVKRRGALHQRVDLARPVE